MLKRFKKSNWVLLFQFFFIYLQCEKQTRLISITFYKYREGIKFIYYD